MAILGTYIDQITGQSFAASAGAAPFVSFATHQHAIGEAPDTVFPILASVEQIGLAPPALLACGANASVSSIGIAYASGATSPGVGYNVLAVKWHSLVK